jgi:hypothetical protein
MGEISEAGFTISAAHISGAEEMAWISGGVASLAAAAVAERAKENGGGECTGGSVFSSGHTEEIGEAVGRRCSGGADRRDGCRCSGGADRWLPQTGLARQSYGRGRRRR